MLYTQIKLLKNKKFDMKKIVSTIILLNIFMISFSQVTELNGKNVGIGYSNFQPKKNDHPLMVKDKMVITVSASGDKGSRIAGDKAELIFGEHKDNTYRGIISMEYTQSNPSYANPKMVFKLQKRESGYLDNVLERMTIYPSGNVGIGTKSDTKNYKLAVVGSIISDEVRVLPETQWEKWPDYVFKSDYNLPSIESVEKFILKNKHLKNIPSAKTVKEEGIDLGVMNAKLLKKVEELTLYLIKQNKVIKSNKKEINSLKQKMKSLNRG